MQLRVDVSIGRVFTMQTKSTPAPAFVSTGASRSGDIVPKLPQGLASSAARSAVLTAALRLALSRCQWQRRRRQRVRMVQQAAVATAVALEQVHTFLCTACLHLRRDYLAADNRHMDEPRQFFNDVSRLATEEAWCFEDLLQLYQLHVREIVDVLLGEVGLGFVDEGDRRAYDDPAEL